MALDNKYSLEMVWSDVDGAYLSTVRELPGCIADGATPVEALQNIQVVMQEWLETAMEEGREIPPPLTLEILTKSAIATRGALKQQFENRVQEAVVQLFKNFSEQQSTSNISSWMDRGFVGFEGQKLAKSR